TIEVGHDHLMRGRRHGQHLEMAVGELNEPIGVQLQVFFLAPGSLAGEVAGTAKGSVHGQPPFYRRVSLGCRLAGCLVLRNFRNKQAARSYNAGWLKESVCEGGRSHGRLVTFTAAVRRSGCAQVQVATARARRSSRPKDISRSL